MSIGEFEPMWLHSGGSCLYAALHAGASADRATTGVLLAPPLLHELPRTRRFLAEVASGLAAQGLPCLRFDFYGTGDSDGHGDELDFTSMASDLGVAATRLRERTGVGRIVLLAWRAAALSVREWMDHGADGIDLVVLWEPITDGASWIRELESVDARERAERPPPRAGLRIVHDRSDGQLMGYPISPGFREQLLHAHLSREALGANVPVWGLVRDQEAAGALGFAKTLPLPAGAAVFNEGAAMDTTFFFTPPVQRFVDELGRSLLEPVWS